MTINRTFDDLAAEIDGVSSLLMILSSGFLDGDLTRVNHNIIGEALFALENYTERIGANLQNLADKHEDEEKTA